MPAPTRTPHFRPPGTPAYYQGRPASVWITALHRRAHKSRPQLAAPYRKDDFS